VCNLVGTDESFVKVSGVKEYKAFKALEGVNRPLSKLVKGREDRESKLGCE